MELVYQDKFKSGCSLLLKDTHYQETVPVFYVIARDMRVIYVTLMCLSGFIIYSSLMLFGKTHGDE